MCKVHVFTKSGLGDAPFRFLGVHENVFDNGDGTTKGGGTCAHCGKGIRWEYLIQSTDGKKSTVGCDCILKIGDDKLAKDIAPEKLRLEREARERRAKANFDKLLPDYQEALVKLAHVPHPNSYFANEGKTMVDYFDYMTNGSTATKVKYMKAAIKRANNL